MAKGVLLFLFAVIGLGGCISNPSDIDRSFVNQTPMSFDARPIPRLVPHLTTLDSIFNSGAIGGCKVCAQ